MNRLSSSIRHARPSLKKVSPVSYWFTMLMGIFNIFIGIAFLTIDSGYAESDLALKSITAIVPLFMWGILFTALGVVKLYAIFTNRWSLSRHTLMAGVLLKSGWAVALTVRSFYQPDNIFLNSLWITMAITQIICYIYFLPPTEPSDPDGGGYE